MLIKHLLSIDIGNYPVAFKASRALRYSLAMAVLSFGTSSFIMLSPAVRSAPKDVLEVGLTPIVTLALLSSAATAYAEAMDKSIAKSRSLGDL